MKDMYINQIIEIAKNGKSGRRYYDMKEVLSRALNDKDISMHDFNQIENFFAKFIDDAIVFFAKLN